MIRDEPGLAVRDPGVPFSELVQDLLQQHVQTWWACERDFPAMQAAYSPADHRANEKELANLVDGLAYELNHIPEAEESRQAQAGRLKTRARQFAGRVFNLEPRHIDFIESSGLLAATQEFTRMARSFDPKISAMDIYQAGRNVMTMNLMQLLLGLPVEVTPSVFAYSMLYPYTDNYLDNPDVSPTTKLAFNHRFQRRLAGDAIRPANPHEAVIGSLVDMVEEQWDRSRYPRVYESLLAIHAAQVKSLGLAMPSWQPFAARQPLAAASPYELDVLGVSFEKGGTSVLADGYLIAGWLTRPQAALMFGYGCFTQLMDDLEDVLGDLKAGQVTAFSQTANHWPLDKLTSRLFHFGRAVFADLSAFPSPAAGTFKEIMDRTVDPLLLDSAGRAGHLYSKEYLRQLEQHFPFRFSALRGQRQKLERRKINLEQLLSTFVVRG